MIQRNIKLKINEREYKLIINLLMKLRNKLIEREESADMVNELLFKIIK